MAAVAATPIEEPLDEEIRSAALAVPQASPAWPTISFALVQRWIHDQKLAEARARLHLVLEGSAPLRPSTRNAFAQLRGQIPETYAETLRDGLYVPAGYDDEEGPGRYVETTAADAPPWLADEGSATRLAATIPARKLVELAARPEWPRRTRRQILLAAWSRAVIVNALPTARDAAAQLIRAEPSLAPELQKWLAEPEGSQRFAAIALMLRWPGASPYLEPEWERAHLNTLGALESSWATNWWCERPLRPRVDYVLAPRPALAAMAPEAATAEEIAANAREWTRLQAAGNAPDFFAREVLAWDAAHPHDPRTAEALHDVVRAARLGCRDEDTPALTGKAFRALHQHFPKSRWAAQTPIWQ